MVSEDNNSSTINTTNAKLLKNYADLLSQKDEKIDQLENENRALKEGLVEKSTEFQQRVDELVKELDRYGELVDKLQTKINFYEQNNRSLKRPPLVIQSKSINNLNNSQSTAWTSVPAPATIPKGVAKNQMMAPNAISTTTTTTTKNPRNTDEVCAALSSFVEENKMPLINSSSSSGKNHQNTMANSETDDEIQPEVMEYVNNLLFMNGGNELIQGLCMDEKQIEATKILELLTSIQNGSDSSTMTEQKPPNRQKFSHYANTITDSTKNSTKVATTSLKSTCNSSTTQQQQQYSNVATTNGTTTTITTPQPKPLSEEERKTIDKMQERVAENVARLGNRPLNTTEIAKQCKKLLNNYNIGQRLFAKAVMCQVVKSQGSLSELLSKPRVWHKLTDKGREAFRRIYGWLCDDVAIELLCTMSPRRVAMPCDKIEHPPKECYYEDYNSGEINDNETINNIVTANGRQQSPAVILPNWRNNDEECLTSSEGEDEKEYRKSIIDLHSIKAPNTNFVVTKTVGLSPTIGDTPCSSSLSNSDSATASNATSSFLPLTTTTTTIINGVTRSTSSRWRHDDIPKEKIIGIFEAEKAKLREQETNLETAISARSTSPSSHSASGSSKKRNPDDPNCSFQSMSGDEFSTNTSTPYNANNGSYGRIKSEPLPIVQEQFEKYPYLDTEEVVKQIKDYLSRNSVSQRQFGEKVLGLSQGSVSDLLARPKSWGTLTHKGREPFIRMQVFLDEHGNDEPHQIAGLGAPINYADELIMEKNDSKNGSLHHYGMEDECRETPESNPNDVLINSINERIKIVKEEPLNLAAILKNRQQDLNDIIDNEDPQTTAAQILRLLTPNSQLNNGNQTNENIQPYEIDTFKMSKNLKDYLAMNGISQRVFGEQVMNMTSGSISDLLSRPKPWQQLSFKGRESYTKMAEFLEDPAAMEQLKAGSFNGRIAQQYNNNLQKLQNSDEITVKDYVQRTVNDIKPVLNGIQSGFNNNNNNNYNSINNNFGEENPLKRKMGTDSDSGSVVSGIIMNSGGLTFTSSGKKIPRFQRTIITDKQREALLYVFQHEQRPSTKMIDQLGVKLGLSSRTVTNWFHNYRTRQKAREIKLASEGITLPQTITPNSASNEILFKDLSELIQQNKYTSGSSIQSNGTTSLAAATTAAATAADSDELPTTFPTIVSTIAPTGNNTTITNTSKFSTSFDNGILTIDENNSSNSNSRKSSSTTTITTSTTPLNGARLNANGGGVVSGGTGGLDQILARLSARNEKINKT